MAKAANLEKLIVSARIAIRRQYQASLDEVRAARVEEADWALGSRSTVPNIKRPTILFPDVEPDQSTNLLGRYQTHKGLGVTQYRRPDSNDLVFTDYHVCIVMHVSDDADVTTALHLAASRWEVVDVTGSKQFQEQCARIADELGIRVSGQHIKNVQKDDGHAKEAQLNEEKPLSDLVIMPISPPISQTALATATQRDSNDAAAVRKNSSPTDLRLETATSIKPMIGQPSAGPIKNSSGSKEKFGRSNAIPSTPSSDHGIKVGPETVRLAVIYKFFHAAHWDKSDYPESSSNDVAMLDHSGLHTGHPKSSNELQVKNKSLFSSSQMQAARAASASMGRAE